MWRVKRWLVCLALVDATASGGELYHIDPEHTFSSFEYMHWGLSLQRGRFDKNFGTIELDAAAKTGAIDIQIEAASISTGSELFNSVLRSNGFFDVANHPKIIFKSTGMQFDDDRPVRAVGELTIAGITKPVSLEITRFHCRFMILYLKPACGANGFAKILRSDFNLGRYVPFVSDEVTLHFSVEGIRE